MKRELAIKQIFDDFTNKTILTDKETEVLILYIKGDSIVKIANETSQGTATVSKIIAQLDLFLQQQVIVGMILMNIWVI